MRLVQVSKLLAEVVLLVVLAGLAVNLTAPLELERVVRVTLGHLAVAAMPHPHQPA